MNFPEELLKYLRAAQHIAVLTGAGVSAESGIATFRDAQSGLWAKYNPRDLASIDGFRKDPKLVWEWYTWRRDTVAQAAPNPGHHALVDMAHHYSRFTLITQNIDGLHTQAGSGEVGELVELHGNIHRARCFDCAKIAPYQDGAEEAPRCPDCGGLLRPDVVWFGENLPRQALESAWQAAKACDAFFSIGTSGVVEPAASLPFIAMRTGAIVVEINPEATPLTEAASYALSGKSGEVLPELVAALWG